MSRTPHASGDDPATRASELRDLAGPVRGRHAAGDPDDGPELDAVGLPADSPDARTDPEVDEVRADLDDDAAGDLEDQYRLRSMGAQPNPTEGDPGSYLNM